MLTQNQFLITIRWTNPTDVTALAKVIRKGIDAVFDLGEIKSVRWIVPGHGIAYSGVEALPKVIADGCTSLEIIYQP